MSNNIIQIGTRRSRLATWQAEFVQQALQQQHPELDFQLTFITTQGDTILNKPLVEIGGKGLFTLELENALRSGEIDLAVHSLKDLPTDMPNGFILGAVPERANPFDAFISRSAATIDELPMGAIIGTSSLRRQAQLRHYRPDLQVMSIRGNVNTRIKKALNSDGPYDAIILAVAGLERLALDHYIGERINTQLMLPAPGQGALGIQCRTGDQRILDILSVIDHEPTHLAVTAERSYLNELEAGCRLPVAAYAHLSDVDLILAGRVSSVDGTTVVEGQRRLPIASMQPDLRHKFAVKLGRDTAREAKVQGAGQLIAAVKAKIAGEENG